MLFSNADKGLDSWKTSEEVKSKDIYLKKFVMMFLNAILEMFTNIFLEKFFIIIRKQALVSHEE